MHYVKDADSDICEEIELSDGTFNYKPLVDESEKPKIGSEYSTIDKCIEMYAKYAEKSRFTIRKSTQEKLKSGIPARKYLLCNKEGLPKGVNKDTMSEETSENQIRTGNNFSFEYVVENSQLSALFWADEMSKYNYKEFGDTISFDATFRTNKYNMVFVPFTGIDNHRKCVTFGAGMLSNETTKSYKWLLTCFLKAFHKQPRLVVTDQDPAMRNAIASVFNESTHRLYFVQSTDNRENKWLSDMYNIRNRWIPAYFKDVELCGLMRTTSRSESENSFFSNFTSGGSTLINFMMCFEAAMERQRHRQEILDDSTMQKIPRFKTKLPIERYAQKKYTKTMFTLIQERINSLFYDCHRLAESVSTDKSDGSVICSCMNFARFGFLCRHIFCVLKGNGVEIIPDKYILKRWKRDILPPHIRRKRQMFGFEGGRYMECSATVYSAVEYCLNLLAKDEGKLIEFVENVKRLKTEVEEANPNAKQLSKKEMFNLVLGVEKPEVNTVKNPEPCSNKGNASGGQRKKSEIEKLREHMKKHRRLCKKCVKYRRHDSRNCTKKPDEIPTDSDSTVVSD
ncbi:FAR1-related sequence 5-like protein [Tanacetum coccineum]